MKKLTTFICNFVICIALAGLTAGINGQSIEKQELSGTFSNENKDQQGEFVRKPPLDLKTVPEGAYHPGELRIKFSRDFEKTLESIDFKVVDNDHVKTGIAALDELHRAYKVYEYTPMLRDLYEISEASLQYKERHREWGFHLWYDLKVDDEADIIEAMIDFEKLDEVKIAEPVLKIEFDEYIESRPAEKESSDLRWSPDDPLYPQQWHFHNTGQQGGLEGMDCNAEAAWDIETGNADVIVAIMDRGMEYYHDDLEGNMWEDIGPEGTGTFPESHGTHVGGTVGAVSNNDLGVAGLAGGSGDDDGVRLMTISRVSYGFEAGCVYAADNDASILQNSWGYSSPGHFPPSVKNAIDYFNEHGGGDALDGGLTVFSTGNNNANFERYPAYYEGCFAVNAHDRHGSKSTFSNYGEWTDIIAPGTDVISTEVGNTYSTKSGTSMSAPHVSGAAALVVSHAYGQLTREDLWDILKESANPDIYDYNGPYYDGKLGAGRLDAYAALLLTDPSFTVTFDVKDEKGDEITDAIVTFDGVTNDPGDYVFEEIEEGTYDYKVEREGYYTVEDEVTVEENTTVEVIMELITYTVTFDVVDEDDNPITGAVITLDDIENEPGDYVFENIAPETYEYTVEKDGYFTVEDDVTVEEDTTVEVTMIGAYVVTFNIEDEDGNEITDAIITFDDVEYDPGEYVFEDLEAGTYDYKVEKEKHFTVEDEVVVEEDVTLVITLFKAHVVTFEVEDLNGNEITDAVITFDEIEYAPGEYVIEDIKTGTYDYKVEKEGFNTIENSTEVKSDVFIKVVMETGTYVDMPGDVELKVFPNPTRDMFTVKSGEMIRKIYLVDISGQIVKDLAINALQSEISVNNLSEGVYFMQIHTAESVITKRVQVAR